MSCPLKNWTFYNEYSSEEDVELLWSEKCFIVPHEMLLVVLSFFAIIVNIIMIQPFVHYESLKIPAYRYLMEWSFVNIIYLAYTPGFRRIWTLLFDKDYSKYGLFYGLEKGAQLTEMLIPFGYLMDTALGHPLPNCSALVPLTLVSLVANAIFISVFYREESFQQLLCEVNLGLYLGLTIIAIIYHVADRRTTKTKNKYLRMMMEVVSVHLMFWFLYWTLSATSIVFPEVSYDFYLSILARCVGCCSPIMKMAAVIYCDKRYFTFFFPTSKTSGNSVKPPGKVTVDFKHVPPIVVKVSEVRKY